MATLVAPPPGTETISTGTGGGRSNATGPIRLLSLDAFRGFIMFVLAANGFGLRRLADQPAWAWLAHQFDHVAWEGLVFWDLIQPSFMFMVGVALPFSVANRRFKGDTDAQVLKHVAFRAFMLIAWSQIIMSVSRGSAHFQLINVLSQIGFTYLLAYLIMQLPFRGQIAAAAGILAGHWGLFVLFPGQEGPFSKADNVGAVIDQALGLKYSGFYVTINFISSTITTLIGAWVGRFLMEPGSHAKRMKVLIGAAVAGWVSGLALALLNPMVKRIWTASFTLFSAGWVLALLAFFYWLVEVRKQEKLVFPLRVVGMNSIFIYTVSIVLSGWLNRAVGAFTFNYEFLGIWGPVAQATTVVLVMWYLCYWLYQRKIFFRF
ncbi:MAG: DUF5009 domain-containing protein [Acidobacteria bacterium]|nr:DUF5009 domain-containing protein [Acidobacteriota bacterium]